MRIENRFILICAIILILPVFACAESTQTIAWDAVEFAGGYRLEVTDAAGKTVVDESGEANSRDLRLPPGSYRYRITALNLLGKPEFAGAWYSLTVKKAERPMIDSVSPNELGIDDLAETITIAGTSLTSETEFFLVEQAAGGASVPLAVLSAAGSGLVEVTFSGTEIRPGLYAIRARNPGGLESEARDRFRVLPAPKAKESRAPRRESSPEKSAAFPVIASVAAGWAGYIPVSDGWYTSTWGRGLYPAGASARADIAFRMGAAASAGLRASAAYGAPNETVSGISVTTDIRRFEGSLFFRYAVSPFFSAAAGAGGGAALTYVRMDSGQSGLVEVASLSPLVGVFAEAQCALGKNLTLSVGVSAEDTIVNPRHFVAIVPVVAVGWSF
jgi:hypothetical protein